MDCLVAFGYEDERPGDHLRVVTRVLWSLTQVGHWYFFLCKVGPEIFW